MSIEVMKQVVKEAVYHRGGYWIIPEKEFSSLRQAIAESEKQEPVAYVETKEVHGQMCSFIYRADSTSLLPDGSKLYTHPQPKQEKKDE
jgi:hypothetical protein